MRKLRFGVLGAARIATTKVIPAMQRGTMTEIAAIASRDAARAAEAAGGLGIAKAYGRYEELLADPEIDAIYNPLPNHLHVPWSIRAAEAGKHVLCEKPIGMNVADTRKLMDARDRTGVTIGEAFMVNAHPQWMRVVELVRGGHIGGLRAAVCSFGYSLLNRRNIRNILGYGGGGLMDIGCYPIHVSRLVFGEEPRRVAATVARDANMGTDILTSAILEFPSGHCIFTCSTQIVGNQSVQFLGTKGKIDLEIPFNAVPDAVSRIRIDDGSDLRGSGVRVEEFAPADQYTLQGDLFARAVYEHTPPPVPLEDSLRNMAVIDAVFRAAETGRWEEPLA
ncbi:MAG: Gfo/Idh/MocA family oxidoreductase [Bryobacteraceae bacterium]